MEFNTGDFIQCDRLIWSIANREYQKYFNRVSFTKLEKEDFYQNGWVAMMDCINKGINNLDYICVAIRRAMYRGVENSSIVKTTNKQELWFYISGHEVRLDKPLDLDDGEVNIQETIPDKRDVSKEACDRVLINFIIDKMSDQDKKEIKLLYNEESPTTYRLREGMKKRARQLLDGENPYKMSVAKYHSDIPHVTYDKSKDRWVFSLRINGKHKTFIRDKSQKVVEDYTKAFRIEEYIRL